MNSQDFKKIKIPDKPGVYLFLKEEKILYIGKATSLRDRTKSYFNKDLINTRGPIILDMVTLSNNIKWQETDNVLEALILEASLIKKYQPKYNTKEKDNKSFNYVCITNEKIPKVLIVRGRNISDSGEKKVFFSAVYGPFPNGSQLKEAMKIVRRLFPYLDEQSNKKNNFEFYRQLGLVPETKIIMRENISEKDFSLSEYKKNIKNLKLFFQGKKKKIIIDLKKEMMKRAKEHRFEEAGEIKRKIFALEHINDISLIRDDITQENVFGKISSRLRSQERGRQESETDLFQKHFPILFRIEAYDIAHMSGQNMVGVMVVVENREVIKKDYRKFIIKTQKDANDTGALEEILSRRLRHTEWGLPNLVVLDGGKAQLNIAKRVLKKYQFNLPAVSVIKDDRHKAKAIIGEEDIIKKYEKDILLANSEAHRFAINFHKNRRNKNFIK